MLQGEHSAILLTFIKLPFVFKIFVLSIFKWTFTQVLLYTLISDGLDIALSVVKNLYKGLKSLNAFTALHNLMIRVY